MTAPSQRARVRRLPERAAYDPEAIHAVLDAGLLCHVGYLSAGSPVVIPTLYARRGNAILLHGSPSSGLARAVREGSDLSVAVTVLDGLVVARSAFNSSANYRSVVVHGKGRLLDAEDRAEGLDVIVDHLIPGRLADARPVTPHEIRSTMVVEIPIDEASAKIRTGPPKDEEADLELPIWAGVVPLRLSAGSLEPSPDLPPGIDPPDYLLAFGG